MPIVPLQIDGREIGPHKATISPFLVMRTVLARTPWEFVSLWLTRERKHDALFFWNQAREFYTTSVRMALRSSPLLLYYSFMNAAKSLLTSKGIVFDPMHGVRSGNTRGPTDNISLSNETVRIQNHGILPALSLYLGENEPNRLHTLQEILFNLPFVHRTYCLTYKTQRDMFIPLTDCVYVFNTNTKQAYFRANLSKDFAHRRFLRRLPPTLIPDTPDAGVRAIRSAASVVIGTRTLRTVPDREAIVQLNRQLRPDVQYIKGAQTLWYAKGVIAGPRRLARFPLTLTLAAMHRLSEICRYKPMELDSLLAGQKNWLLSEFIQAAPEQFIDELAAEITGHQFLAPNVRAAT